MKKLFLLLVPLFMFSCAPVPLEKPFIIVYKHPASTQCQIGYCRFGYTDKNGLIEKTFCDLESSYSIGDTL
jgi:hypothetical protein